jgi:hypothetical protein
VNRLIIVAVCQFLSLVVLGHASSTSVFAQQRAEAMFIEEFVKAESEYPSMVDKEMSIEGRLSFVAKDVLRFLKSDIEFHIPRDANPPQKSGRLEVTGELRRRNGKTYFEIRHMRGLPTESESIDGRLKLPNVKVQDYYDLAKWAQKRADYYGDTDLAAKANDVRMQGLNLARKDLPKDDGFALLDVAARAGQQGLSTETLAPINHEGLRLAFSQRDPKSFDFESFIKMVTDKLPGAGTSAPSANLLLANQYRSKPLATYETAPPISRRFLERVFYQDVVQAGLKGQLREDGANGKELAEKLNALLPDSPELSTPFMEKYLAYRFQALKTANRQQALELADTYRKQGDMKTYEDVLNTWLDYRKGRLNMDSVADSVSLADDYLTLVKNTAKASEILDALNRKHPNVEEIEIRLARLGYTKVEGKWLTPGQFAALPKDPVMEAMRQGVVSEGMTPEQVYKTLGKPTSSTRALSASGYAESWTYNDAKLTIRFKTRTGQSPIVEKVTSRK